MSNKGDDELERRLRDVLSSRGLGVPVSPDAIDRIHAGARRRQQRRTVASALGAVAIIAIAAIAIGVRSDGHGSTITADNHTPSPSPAISSAPGPAVSPSAALASTTSTPSSVASPVVVEPTTSGVASSPPTKVFNPVSVSAISVNDYWVLGYNTTSDGGIDSAAIMRTTDAGQHFTTIGSPGGICRRIASQTARGGRRDLRHPVRRQQQRMGLWRWPLRNRGRRHVLVADNWFSRNRGRSRRCERRRVGCGR